MDVVSLMSRICFWGVPYLKCWTQSRFFWVLMSQRGHPLASLQTATESLPSQPCPYMGKTQKFNNLNCPLYCRPMIKISYSDLNCFQCFAASCKQNFKELQFLALLHGINICRPGVAAWLKHKAVSQICLWFVLLMCGCFLGKKSLLAFI